MTIRGSSLGVYGGPYTPQHGSRVFQYPKVHTPWYTPFTSEFQSTKIWSRIPPLTDILITHGPPLAHLEGNINLGKSTDGFYALLTELWHVGAYLWAHTSWCWEGWQRHNRNQRSTYRRDSRSCKGLCVKTLHIYASAYRHEIVGTLRQKNQRKNQIFGGGRLTFIRRSCVRSSLPSIMTTPWMRTVKNIALSSSDASSFGAIDIHPRILNHCLGTCIFNVVSRVHCWHVIKLT